MDAVVVAATRGGVEPHAVLDGYRAGLVVPVVAAVLGVLLTAPGLRRAGA